MRLRIKEKFLIIGAPEEGISTCRSKGPKGEVAEITCDYVIASRSLQGEIKNMGVVKTSNQGHTQGSYLSGRNRQENSRSPRVDGARSLARVKK